MRPIGIAKAAVMQTAAAPMTVAMQAVVVRVPIIPGAGPVVLVAVLVAGQVVV
jgi:hypothetical protein